MSETILLPVILLCCVGLVAAVILFLVSKKFKVQENPLIDEVEDILPSANCGACGYPGCRKFAQVFVESEDINDLYCPVGGHDVMKKIAELAGKEVVAQAQKVAVVRCNGSCEHTQKRSSYDGVSSCRLAVSTFAGEAECSFGCVGYGDCVDVCNFDAIHINTETGLPEVITENCTACNKCVEICPRDIIELRKTNKKDLKIFVSCVNKDKGALARKVCKVACIGCGKCVKVCPHDAITLENNLAYIDDDACKLCRKCVSVCPTQAIHETNFPPRKVKVADEEKDVVTNK
ncbi:MAG: RnfABCDGE type electron transport complex subunit B [Bacteroidales bacterium]